MSLFGYQLPTGGTRMDGFVRMTPDGPVVCSSCGCRLQEPASWLDEGGESAATWRHFEGLPGRDARGCRVDCVDQDHGRDGRAVG